MKIILSPTKKMKTDVESFDCKGSPVFLSQTEKILSCMQDKSYDELKNLWGCNDTIAQQNKKRLDEMDLCKHLTPAIVSYEGIAYQYMAPAVFETSQLDYVQEHLRILSGFYGVLKPMDGVRPYRLEMQTKLKVGTCRNLYEFWGNRLYREVADQDGVIVNLASKEYSKCIETYLRDSDTYITCTFGEVLDGKIVQKSTFSKMARGEMVRFMAEHRITNPQEIKEFDRLGFCFRHDLSTETQYIFERKSTNQG